MNKEVVLDTDDGIAEYKTNIEGWVGKDGRFYGKDKNLAIYANSTHKKCENGHIYSRGWVNCNICEEAKRPSKYMQLKFKEWDEVTPLNIYMTDKYFFNKDEVYYYMNDEEVEMDELELVICDPNYLSPIDEDIWEDVLPEDMDLKDVTNKEFLIKLSELNDMINEHEPVSWNGGNYRTTIR